jgi:uncharacterized membrane protein
MTVAELCPSPAEVEANTPATRDRAIDVIRIVSLVAVVVGHTIMATSTLRDDVFIWSNLLTASVVLQALTWVFQIMPLFFFAGVGTYAFIAVIDAIRINVDGMSGLGYLNLVVWLIPGMFGVAYRRRRLADRRH